MRSAYPWLRHQALLILLLTIAIVLGMLTPYFWTTANVVNIFEQAAIPTILALGMCFVIGSGQIDLSVGSTLALAALVFGEVANQSESLSAGVAAAITLGAACGTLNGVFSAWMPSFVVTLATMASYRGLALAFSDENAVVLSMTPPDLARFGIPWLSVLALIATVAALFVVRRTKFGLRVLASGSNELAAWNLGLDVRKIRAAAFAISGGAAGLGGALLTLRLGGARPSAGVGYELDAIAAAIVGGAALSGGRVSIIGTLGATLLFSIIRNSLTLLDVTAALQQVFIGAILIIVVLTRNIGLRTLGSDAASR
jgi:ribose transport system permease protein